MRHSRSRRFAAVLGSSILVWFMAFGSPAAAVDPSWALLAAGERSFVLKPTGLDVTTLHNGTAWYYNVGFSMGFAPAGAAIRQNSADVNGSGNFGGTAIDATTDYRLSWHLGPTTLEGGWRTGGDLFLNSGTITRAIYQANVMPSYYPNGPQLSVPVADLRGWSRCYSAPYGDSIALVDLWRQCDGNYLLLAGGDTQLTGADAALAEPPSDEPQPVAPVWVDPVLPLGPVMISGIPAPGNLLTCIAPQFDPVAHSYDFVWLVDGEEVESVKNSERGWTFWTLPNTTRVESTVMCRVFGNTSIGTGSFASEVVVKPAKN